MEAEKLLFLYLGNSDWYSDVNYTFFCDVLISTHNIKALNDLMNLVLVIKR